MLSRAEEVTACLTVLLMVDSTVEFAQVASLSKNGQPPRSNRPATVCG